MLFNYTSIPLPQFSMKCKIASHFLPEGWDLLPYFVSQCSTFYLRKRKGEKFVKSEIKRLK
jgi:hypothetical protein